VQFDAFAADDQIVPFFGRCATVLEPEALVEAQRRVELARIGTARLVTHRI